MGLNQNKGQKILLRLRTDDLCGFRKMESIRKVLFHELAHNVHSEHDGKFFQLMREVERDCNELDWTKGNGQSVGGDNAVSYSSGLEYSTEMESSIQGGTYRLGGQDSKNNDFPNNTVASSQSRQLTVRELAARAAMVRMSQEEQEIEQACGCTNRPTAKITVESESRTSSKQMEEDGDMS